MSTSREKKHRVNESYTDSSIGVNEEPVQIVLSSVDAGISLVKVEFQPDLRSDEFLVAGFLTALSCIGDIVFSKPLDELKFGKYTMLVKVEPPFLFCYAFRGRTNHAIQRLNEFVKILLGKKPLWNSLKNTISTGVVDKVATSSVREIATLVFTQSEISTEGC